MKFSKTIGSAIVKAYSVLTNKCVFRRCVHIYSTKEFSLYSTSIQTFGGTITKRFIHNDDIEDDVLTDGIDVYSELYQQPQSMKHLLYPQSKDVLINKLNESGSLVDVLAFMKNHGAELNTNHITQIILVLWDLQKLFYHISLSNSTSYIDNSEFSKLNENYIQTLKDDEIYNCLLELLENKKDEFSVEQLSYILWCLNKMGISSKEKIMSMLVLQFQKKFKNDSLVILARFITAIYVKRDLSFYYNIQPFIPTILESIDKCNTMEQLSATTVCLNSLNNIISKVNLMKYKQKVRTFLETNVLVGNEYKTIISIMTLLDYPHWREKNVPLIIKCLDLLKDHLHFLNVNELLVVHQVFCNIQEPGHILNEIQRCAYRYLQQLEEEMSPQLDVRLKLFSCVLFFAPPSHRPHFKQIIQNYIDYNLDISSLLELHKIILFTKLSDVHICSKFWKRITAYLDDKHFLNTNLLKVCQNYISFNEDLRGRRCFEFETKIGEILEYEMEHKLGLIPPYFPTFASFLLIFGKSRRTLNVVISNIQESAERLNSLDCLNISHGLQNAIIENKLLTKSDITSIRDSLDICTYKTLRNGCDISTTNLLLKGYICRNSKNENLYYRLLDNFRNKKFGYSLVLKNTLHNLFVMNTLVPDIVNMAVEYTIRDNTDILGFNAERIVYLCYHFGYLPNKHEPFFQIIIDVMLRDQERMSGLSYLQACLSLCFFHKLPQFFVEQIFNTEFLEKLDVELAHCYFKDKYPSRVRYNMMLLNRAVCLDYPELNVPWFHEKYVQEEYRKESRRHEMDYALFKSIKECLIKLAKQEIYVEANEISSYGYHIDFTVDLQANNELTNVNKPTQKVAVLVILPTFYTRFHPQLKGFYQLKIRHLEILGYKVSLIDSAIWKELIPIEKKMNYLINIVKSEEIYANLLKTLHTLQKIEK